MLKLRDEVKVFVYIEPIDARKSIDGLTVLVDTLFNDNPQSGNLYLFFNKVKDKVKILYWDNTGFVLYYKRMEKHKFIVPKLDDLTHLEISEVQLQGLLAGLDCMLMRK